MIYLKGIGMGLLGSVVGVVGYVLIQVLGVVIMLAWQARSGSGGIGAVSSGLTGPLIAAVVGFLVAFGWYIRRSAT